ncbi:MAG: SURF1 family cytochrome oxidase biogenesis protein [Pseudomonadota bacterium]
MRFRPLPIMTACVLPALAVLCLLGSWQWQRYGEKLAAQTDEIEWQRFGGEIAHSEPFFVSTLLDGDPAWRLVKVIESDESAHLASTELFIGIVPPLIDFDDSASFEAQEGVFVQPSPPTRWAPDPDGATFYAYDVAGIRSRLPEELAARLSDEVFEPRHIDRIAGELRETLENPWANPALADPLPPARHLGYALTWWGIGVGLIAIYFVFHLQSGRLTLKQAA